MSVTATRFIKDFINQHQLAAGFIESAQQYYLPLAKQLYLAATAKKQTSAEPFYLGINGAQGVGKSTLTQFLTQYLAEQHQLIVANLSLDDFYLSQKKRQRLAQTIHPLLATRGVPGSHDIKLLNNVLMATKQQHGQISLPRFNKATDNPTAKTLWQIMPLPVDIVLFEGWCWGVLPQTEAQLQTNTNALEFHQDEDQRWRNYVNQQLTQHYQPLYPLMDQWLMLKTPSFDCIANWRWQQEQHLALISQAAPKLLMSKAEIFSFIQYFQRLTEHGFKALPAYCHHVFELDANRTIVNYLQQHTPKSFRSA